MSAFIMTLASPDLTGAPRMALSFAAAIAATGARMLLACGKPSAAAKDRGERLLEMFAERGVQVHVIPRLERHFAPDAWKRLLRLAHDENIAASIGVQQRDRMAAMWLGKKCQIPCVLSMQNQHHFYGPGPLPALKRWLYRRWLQRQCSVAVCSSSVVADEMRDDFRLPPERIETLPNGIEIPPSAERIPGEREQLCRSWGWDESCLLFSNVGRIDRQKGQDILVRAFADFHAQVPSARLVIVGDVSTGANAAAMQRFREEAEAFVAERGLRDVIRFLGWRDDVPAILRSCDAYVHSARWEGCSLAVMEALAIGAATIYTANSGVPAGVVSGETALVTDADPASLTRALLEMASMSHEARREMGLRGRTFATAECNIAIQSARFADIVLRQAGSPPNQRASRQSPVAELV